jgi:hypothetical protein
MTDQCSLFPEAEQAIAERIDQPILQLILGHPGGTLGLALDEEEKAVLRAIRYKRGRSNAIAIREISQLTGLNPRRIKETVRSLRLSFQLPIGSSRHATEGGFYIIITSSDLQGWIKDMVDQMRAEAAVLRAAAGHQASLELIGQLSLELQK